MIIALQNCSLEIAYIGTVEEIRNQQLLDAAEAACREVCEIAAKLMSWIECVFADIRGRVLRAVMPTAKAMFVLDAYLSSPVPAPS